MPIDYDKLIETTGFIFDQIGVRDISPEALGPHYTEEVYQMLTNHELH